MKAKSLLIFLFCCNCSLYSFSQDSLNRKLTVDTTTKIKIDTPFIKHHNPKVATLRSAILPGWGQIYNREYWKVPIVWGALGTAAGFWVYNNTWYKRTKFAYTLVVDTLKNRYNEIDRKLMYNDSTPLSAQSLQFYRNQFRRDRDYSLLWFIGIWALNIADATVFAHLKEFDVSDDLSLKISPSLNPINRSAGFSLSLNVKDKKSKKTFLEAR